MVTMTHRPHALEPTFAGRVRPQPEDESHRAELQRVLAAWIDGTVADPNNPRHQLHTADWVRRQVEDLIEHELRRAALLALASGDSLAAVGRELGLSRWAIAKRWPDLNRQAESYRWFPRHHVEWFKWTAELLRRAPESEARERLEQALEPYRRAIWNWWLLLDTPPLVRAVLATWSPGVDAHPRERQIVSELTTLLESYDATRGGRAGQQLVSEDR